MLGGTRTVAFVPVFVILLWASASSVFVMGLLKGVSQPKRVLVSLCTGVLVTFFAVYLSPKQYQVFYWLSGLKTYLSPMVVYTMVAALFLLMTRLEKIKIHHMLIMGILTFFGGGFSETTTVWFAVLSGFAAAYAWLFGGSNPMVKKARVLILVIFSTTLLSMVLLAVSPYNAVSSRANLSSIPYAFRYSFIYAVDFIFGTLKSAPIPYALLVVFGYLIAHLVGPLGETKNILILRNFGIASLVLYFLCAATMFPTSYAMSAYPGLRALTPAHVTLLVFLVITGWFLPRLQRNLLPALTEKPSISLVVSLAILIVLSAYVSRAIVFEAQDLPAHQARAAAWDVREAMILDAKAAGVQDVVVPGFDSIYLITELKENPGNWVNRCAAQYYGVNSITAEEGYQGVGTYPLGK
jgi:hypothetical protein